MMTFLQKKSLEKSDSPGVFSVDFSYYLIIEA